MWWPVLKSVVIDRIEDYIGKILVSGIAETGSYKPRIVKKDIALCYYEPCNVAKHEIVLSSAPDEKLLSLVKRKKITLIVTASAARELREGGITPDGILLYGTRNFWHKLLEDVIPRRGIEALIGQFRGHIALLRIIGVYQYFPDQVISEYMNTSLYYEYGLLPETVEAIAKINSKILEENPDLKLLETETLKPVHVKVGTAIQKHLRIIHPRAVQVSGEGVIVSAFF